MFNVNKVDRSHAVEVGEVPEAHQPLTKLKPLPDSFAHGFKYIEDARADLLEPYGEFISDIYCEPWTAHDVVGFTERTNAKNLFRSVGSHGRMPVTALNPEFWSRTSV